MIIIYVTNIPKFITGEACRIHFRWNFDQFAPSVKNQLSDVVMLSFHVLESRLAYVSVLGIDHWLGIFVKFEGY